MAVCETVTAESRFEEILRIIISYARKRCKKVIVDSPPQKKTTPKPSTATKAILGGHTDGEH